MRLRGCCTSHLDKRILQRDNGDLRLAVSADSFTVRQTEMRNLTQRREAAKKTVTQLLCGFAPLRELLWRRPCQVHDGHADRPHPRRRERHDRLREGVAGSVNELRPL